MSAPVQERFYAIVADPWEPTGPAYYLCMDGRWRRCGGPVDVTGPARPKTYATGANVFRGIRHALRFDRVRIDWDYIADRSLQKFAR